MTAVDPGAPAGESWLQTVQALLRELPALVSDRVELLSLELQRAARTLAVIVALAVAVAILGATAWLALWAGIIGALVAGGLALHWALLTALLINLSAMALAGLRIVRLLPLLRLPATRRHLSFGPPASPDDERRPAAAAG